jgi:alkanesulfonate monooxygenase SsuD/methylene tetrahydromethanopterin reductase-like flavin-dependent oxidoreductase (luciferase family)
VSVHIGFGTLPGQVPPCGVPTAADVYADILALAGVADQVGFDSLWVSSHHFAANSHIPSPLVLLAAVAVVTQRITLGTAMVLAPFQHPLRFAEDCAVLDQISRGRLLVGLGAGWRKAEFAGFGIPLVQRVGRTSELAQVCRLAWDQERFSFDGKYFQFHDVSVMPKPTGRLQLLLGGSVPAAAERAGQLADGFMGTGTPMNQVAGLRDQLAVFDQAARAAGKDPQQLPIGFHVNAWVSPDGEIGPSTLEAMWHQVGTYQMWHAQDDGGDVRELPPLDEHELWRLGFLGTPEQVVEQVRPWIEEFGHRELHMLFRLHYPGLRCSVAEDALRLFGAEVIPRLRSIRNPAYRPPQGDQHG